MSCYWPPGICVSHGWVRSRLSQATETTWGKTQGESSGHLRGGTVSLQQVQTCMGLFTKALAGITGDGKSVQAGVLELDRTPRWR